MRKWTWIIVIIFSLITFVLGWFLLEMNQFANGVITDGIRRDSLRQLDKEEILITQEQIENNKMTNFVEKLEGQFIIKGANCAGFNFINSTQVTWTNEIDCYTQDTLKIRWLNNSTFFTQDENQNNKECPPRVWIYKVVSFDGKTLILKDIWTGWNNIEDNRIELTKNNKLKK